MTKALDAPCPRHVRDIEHEVAVGNAKVVHEVPRQNHRGLHAVRESVAVDGHRRRRQHPQLNVPARALIPLQVVELPGNAQIGGPGSRQIGLDAFTELAVADRCGDHVDDPVAHCGQHSRAVRQSRVDEDNRGGRTTGCLHGVGYFLRRGAEDEIGGLKDLGERATSAPGIDGIEAETAKAEDQRRGRFIVAHDRNGH